MLLTPTAALAADIPDACNAPIEGETTGEPWVYVLTMAPGPDLWSRFGHNALWVRYGPQDRGTVYNFGVFEATADLVNEWLQGRQYYWLGLRSFDSMVRLYTKEDRDVYAQRLALPPGVAPKLVERLRWLADPERRRYLYHWSDCNCSTRVRDLLDEFLDGTLAPQHQERPEGLTKRAEVMRHVAATWWLWFGLDLVTGPSLDLPLSWWEVVFLPERFYERLEVSTVQWPGQAPRPLVAARCTLNDGSIPHAWKEPPQRGLWLGLIGVALGGVLAASGYVGRSRRWVRVSLGVCMGLVGLVLATLGSVGVWLWWASEIEAFDVSRNLWLVSPLCAVWMGAGTLVAANKGGRLWRWGLAGLPLALASVGVLLSLFPWEIQDNGALQALFWPLLAGGFAAVFLLDKGRDKGRDSKQQQL